MKNYDRFIVWLDYLDSERKRRQGRRVRLDSCVRAPTLEELSEASRRLGLEPQAKPAAHPKEAHRPSGYVSVKKSGPKQQTIMALSKEISKIRGSQRVNRKVSR